MSRALTTVERTFLAMSERIVMNPVVLVRCRGALEVAALEVAILKVQARHPALQVRLVHGEAPWFTTRDVPAVPLRIVEREGDEHWREVVRRELNEPFDRERGPLIRFVLVRGRHACELVCTTDHLNADGRSGLFVLRDVLRAVADPSLRFVPLEDRACFDAHLPGGAWDIGRVPGAVRGILGDYARTSSRVVRGFVDERRRLRGLEPCVAQARPRIEFVHQRIEPARVTALVEVCRGRGTTVQGALMVAASHALAHARGLYERPRGRPRVGCITPIDIRSALTPPVGDHFGIFAWAPTTVHWLRRGARFWDLARDSRARVETLHGQLALAGLRRLLDAHELSLAAGLDSLAALPLALCNATITVSNLGRIAVPRQVGDAEVVSFGFFAMIPDVDAVVAVQTLEALELNYCYCEDRIATETIRALAEGVDAIVDAALGRPARGAAESLVF